MVETTSSPAEEMRFLTAFAIVAINEVDCSSSAAVDVADDEAIIVC
jgi:hypothetical protein